MRRIDKLGRIVIPMDLRQKYGLMEGVAITFSDAGEGIMVQAAEPLCKICRGRIAEGAALPLCDACMEKAAACYQEKI